MDTGGWTADRVREIQAGVRLIREIGPEKYLKLVLNNLK